MLRTTFSLCAMRAQCGMSELKCTPGIDVGRLGYGPPLGRPGLGSHVSNWLGAPQSQSRMQRFCAFFVAEANAGFSNKPEKLVRVAMVPPVNPLRKRRR